MYYDFEKGNQQSTVILWQGKVAFLHGTMIKIAILTAGYVKT